MITEDYVSFETAKLLKERGFDTVVRHYYQKIDDDITYHIEDFRNWNVYDMWYSMPTQQMAMKWLREVHKLEIYPFHDTIQENNNWWFRVEKHTKGCGITLYESDSIYLKFEEACEIAIKYCLENLI